MAALVDTARQIRQRMPEGGLFTGHTWRIAAEPLPLEAPLARELESLGRVLLEFQRAVNLLYRQSAAGKQPAWVAALLDQGKPQDLVGLQRSPAFKNALPQIIRPDLLLTDEGFVITELDSVPGGIGLTAWLNETYGAVGADASPGSLLGGAPGMTDGFASIFGGAPKVRIVVSEESATYRPEMEWLARRLGPRFEVHDAEFTGFTRGDAIYRFFELFDLEAVPAARRIFDLALQGDITLTPPPRPIFEEKLLFALFWNRNLREFWHRELGGAFFEKLRRHIPYTWVMDPGPLPPHAAMPGLDLTDWAQLKTLSQRERELVLKVSGFSPEGWGARSVRVGSDLSREEWGRAVDHALAAFPRSPWVLQRFHKPRRVQARYFEEPGDAVAHLSGRARLCPYYFVSGDGDEARASLGGVLATICPADKKIIHGMTDAILAPCRAESDLRRASP